MLWLSRFWARLFRQRAGPARLLCDSQLTGQTIISSGLEKTATSELMRMCDRYWDSLSEVPSTASMEEIRRQYSAYVNAVNELSKRGREILAWARLRLDHREYDAREQVAFLIGELARLNQLRDDLSVVIEELSKLAVRPMEDDCKELQANSAAVIALGNTRDLRAISVLRRIITSAEWENDDLSQEAAVALGSIVGEHFDRGPSPVQAARQWIQSHDDN